MTDFLDLLVRYGPGLAPLATALLAIAAVGASLIAGFVTLGSVDRNAKHQRELAAEAAVREMEGEQRTWNRQYRADAYRSLSSEALTVVMTFKALVRNRRIVAAGPDSATEAELQSTVEALLEGLPTAPTDTASRRSLASTVAKGLKGFYIPRVLLPQLEEAASDAMVKLWDQVMAIAFVGSERASDAAQLFALKADATFKLLKERPIATTEDSERVDEGKDEAWKLIKLLRADLRIDVAGLGDAPQ